MTWWYGLASVVIVSLISFVGVLGVAIKVKDLKKLLLYLVSFSAGAFFGDVFFHLLPEIVEETGFTLQVSLYVISGIVFSFVVEKVIRWQHCHIPTSKEHPHPFAIMNLVGDSVHNFVDGLIIGASYLASTSVGIATTLAVIFHEIPQEIGDFGVLLHGGFSKGRALFFNFLTALTAILGALVALLLSSIEGLTIFLIPFAAGTFLYIAAADLIPELHKEVVFKRSILQLTVFVLGIAVMYALLGVEV